MIRFAYAGAFGALDRNHRRIAELHRGTDPGARLFLRRKEASEIKRLDRLGQWGRKHGLSAEYEHVSVGDPEFTDKVRGRRAIRLGYWGIGFMALGFLSLAAYHLIAIYHGE